MKPVQYDRIMANSDFHVLNLTYFLKSSLYVRSNSPLILVTYCMQPTHCLCRNWCLNQRNNWENGPTKISRTQFFQYCGQTIWTRSLAVFGVTRFSARHTFVWHQSETYYKTDVFPKTLAGEDDSRLKTRERSGWTILRYMNRRTPKPTKWQKPTLFNHADNEDSDQTRRMPRLIWVFAGRTCHFVGFLISRCVKPKPNYGLHFGQ